MRQSSAHASISPIADSPIADRHFFSPACFQLFEFEDSNFRLAIPSERQASDDPLGLIASRWIAFGFYLFGVLHDLSQKVCNFLKIMLCEMLELHMIGLAF